MPCTGYSAFLAWSEFQFQKSVLGPLYMKDTHKLDSKASFYLFADDISIFFADKNIKKLEKIVNTSLENKTNWLRASKLKLNIDKSQLLFFDISPCPNKKMI